MQKINSTDWDVSEYSNLAEIKGGKLVINNTKSEKITIKCHRTVHFCKSLENRMKIYFYGSAENSGCYLNINKNYQVPLNSETVMPIKVPVNIEFSITVAAKSKIELMDLSIDENYDGKVIDGFSDVADVLVIAPYYPSYVNLYNCAFAHSRTKEYVKNGIKVQVFAVNENNWFQTSYEKDNVSVFVGTHQNLKEVLSHYHYKVVISHFVDEYLFPIFDGNIYNNQKLFFICHGPETIYRYLVNKTRPYFTSPCKDYVWSEIFNTKDYYVKKYAQKDNVEWIFVSDWLKENSEKELGISFMHTHVINNIIDEKLFPYKKKNVEDRKKIVIVRKFDNISQHSIDIAVRTILELSRREIFKDLEFSIYGDGNYYDELIAPVKDLTNVHLYRKFIPNEDLHKVYDNHGIMLLPSRHDTQGVAMCEAASCGLAIVSTRVCAASYFLDEKENHTLAEAEDYVGLADIIERLYKNPDEYLKISVSLSQHMSLFNKQNTVDKEIKLIKDALKIENKLTFNVTKPEKPVLTIGIPAYNVSQYIEKCLVSILNARNSGKIEVLVINDGSTDNTAEIVSDYVDKSNGIVRLINKENGGHGSAINMSIQKAHGKYFRLIDGDDWVDSENLARLVDILENENSDIILTKGSYDYIESAKLENIIDYDSMIEGKQYNFEDLTYENYGFGKYGPLLTTGNYKTKVLRDACFTITEKKPYVDMEFNSFSIKKAKTITFYRLDIYRYLIGREGQTISPEYWKKKYKDHSFIIFNILDKVFSIVDEYSHRKKVYILKNVISPMVDSQIFMFDAVGKLNEIDGFLSELKKYNKAYEYSIDYIKKLDGNSWLILNYYKRHMKTKSSDPIIIPGVRETLSQIKNKKTNLIKKSIKAVTPYGILILARKKRKNRLVSK